MNNLASLALVGAIAFTGLDMKGPGPVPPCPPPVPEEDYDTPKKPVMVLRDCGGCSDEPSSPADGTGQPSPRRDTGS